MAVMIDKMKKDSRPSQSQGFWAKPGQNITNQVKKMRTISQTLTMEQNNISITTVYVYLHCAPTTVGFSAI
jgi:hypothetical protein